ncbi:MULTISPECIES: PaaI family thioesterase [Vitreoscilla]|uniref:PaaI family thioesterase n=1 Tax=Vitreoscilla stercoraria TaxID=61 RepID=A0ABY4ECQ1_VITST|nr:MULTISPECIES: PaaI family thioesterase [Vitreoscilla]AUZ05928.2 hypothetical protein ADP71_26410 [Vitreoscilla sp. C1]UOO92700.1 PaaI family thioesterase [Vitreoscilla stercoraria]
MSGYQLHPVLTEKAHTHMPYTHLIGLQIWLNAEGVPLFHVPFKSDNIGNTFLPALHGGMIGGFIESVATLFLKHHSGLDEFAKVIDFSIDYLRSGLSEAMYASCSLTRQGSRIAHLTVTVWQSDAKRPIAVGRVHCLMPDAA